MLKIRIVITYLDVRENFGDLNSQGRPIGPMESSKIHTKALE